ncbi:MAG TPA: hypothetical protein VIY49_16005 [Bryobacteraceae bacterium]
MTEILGGEYSNTKVSAGLLPGDIQQLTAYEMEMLWRLFQEIGRTRSDSLNIRSEWLEFVEAKTSVAPSYTGEYSNAVSCAAELLRMYGDPEGYRRLLLDHGMAPDASPLTRIAHCKTYVVNEFIRVQVAKEGFKSWKGSNYKGYIGGSLYNRKPRARVAEPLIRIAEAEGE